MPRKAAAVVLLLAPGSLCATPALPQAIDGSHSEIVSFSASNSIDQGAIAQRDTTRPFFFRIENLPPIGSLPFTVDKGSDFQVWLDRRVPRSSRRATLEARSLGLELQSSSDADVKDKVFLDAIPWKSPEHLTVGGRERFIAFDMSLARPYDTPKFWVIHMQVWQCCGGHPPLAMVVVPSRSDDTQICMDVVARNDATEQNAEPAGIVIAEFHVERDRWFHVGLSLAPSMVGEGAGRVRIWVDGMELADWRGNWGYGSTPSSPSAHTRIDPEMGIDLGIYRRRQPNTQTVLIDNIRYGSNLQDISAH